MTLNVMLTVAECVLRLMSPKGRNRLTSTAYSQNNPDSPRGCTVVKGATEGFLEILGIKDFIGGRNGKESIFL
jgi:hypothetical protein